MRNPFRTHLSASTTTPQSTLTDLEKHPHPDNSTSSHHRHPPEHSKPPKLLKFQTLIGIRSPTLLRSDPSAYRPAPNHGIYQRTVDEEKKVKFQYDVSKYVVNVGGMLQIVLGAALTALGAASGPSGAVTVLGAANTVTAGLLTYLKGQGLPIRLEQYLHLLRTLREHIEEREREFLELDCVLDVDEEINRIARMYQEVRQTAEDNAPGTVLPPRGAITSLLKKPDINRSDVPAPRGDKSAGAMLASGLQDLASFGKHAVHEGRSEVEDRVEREKVAAGSVVEKERQQLGAEIQHLGEMAKDALHLGKHP
ncbi:MAG: hypothetical protein Q9169_005437 [Polycauliona sp. 2 TL-2023]